MGYALPSTTDWVTASWQAHKDRNPPSSEPGTDYGSNYGAPLYAVEDGVVTLVSHSNGGGTGRFIQILLDDGRETRSLHLSEVWVGAGERIARGEQIGRTGGSGFGNDHGYGSHVHQTLWPGRAWAAPTIDFAAHVGDPEPPPDPPAPPPEEDEDMPKNSGFSYTRSDGVVICGIANLGSGAFTEWQDGGGAYNSAVAVAFDSPTFAPITESHRNNIADSCAAVRAATSKTPQTVPPSNPLVTPAWIGGIFLGLIGLVEVIRFILDLVV
jgi:murein DD-endopeptidase MepM/ murein hydrolase activator NlpD